jgi:hypothetical protein
MTFAAVGVAFALALATVYAQAPAPRAIPRAESTTAPAGSPAAERAVLDRYCVTCHNERLKTGGLMLDRLDLTDLAQHRDIGEKVVRKLRAGMMPPIGMPRPDAQTRNALIAWMESELDRGAVAKYDPPGLHRLNRTEYRNAIRDLLAVDVDPTKFLPSDNSTHGFDNIAGALTMSPALLEAYLSAGGKISRLAIGDAVGPAEVVYTVPSDATQDYHIEGLPFGTRGGILIRHEFAADGDYSFKITPVAEGNMGQLNYTFGRVNGERLELLLDGALLKTFDWDKEMQGIAVRFGLETPRFHVTAGPHTVGVTFVATNYAPGNDLNEPFLRTTIDTGALQGYTFYPHIGIVRVVGPFGATEATDTPSRQRVFVCHPATRAQETPCARRILGTIARRAYRRPVTAADVDRLMPFYESGRRGGSFDAGVEKALRRILVDPEFIYRGEAAPRGLPAGETYRISDVTLASRLSFFLWSSIPDDQLLDVAARGQLRAPAMFERQVRRMLADPKSDAFVENFTGQWLNLRSLDTVSPDPLMFPNFDDNLRQAYRREIELLFQSVLRENRSVVDLLTANDTFVDERLAREYRIPGIYGSRFRRVMLPPALDVRRGLLGKGALMAITSQATRTSPVTRGKWFLETFLGVSPPDPPPNVPQVKPIPEDRTGNSRPPTMRQQMALHHSSPTCASCHAIFEPIGLAMENFDAIGTWRLRDEGGSSIDATATFTDGTAIDGVVGLRELLVRHSDQFVRVVVERMLTYALGRGAGDADMPTVRSIVRGAAPHDYRLSDLVLGVVNSAPFQHNTKEVSVQDQTARR